MKTLTDLFPKLDIHNTLLEKLSDTEIKNAYAKKSTREIGFTLCGQFDDGELDAIKNAVIKECNASDVIIELEAKEILRMKDMLISIMAENSGQPYEKVKEDCERDHFLTAQQALEYGLIDKVVTRENK